MGRAQASTELSPLTGVLDLRSPPDRLPAGSVRWRQNFRTIDQNALQRAQGFRKFLSSTDPYNNDDLHDQLLFLSNNIRQPITLLYQAESSRKQRIQIAANESTVFALNNATHNWKILATDFGRGGTDARGPRFKADGLGDYVLFTNDYNEPQYHVLEQAYPDMPPYLQPIPDLAVIGLTKAKHLWVWKSVVFFADVEMDQTRIPFRILWSDLDQPLSFDPAKTESIAGFFDLNANEIILGGAPLGNVFLIYTSHAIWEMSVANGEFVFREAYKGHEAGFVGLLHYPNTLVALKDEHMYLGQDKIYEFNPQMAGPEAPEWLHRGTKKLFDEIDPAPCDVHIGYLNKDEIYFSYATAAAVAFCPDWTFRVNVRYQVADYMDVGFTAFDDFAPGSSPTIRDFILDKRICTPEEMEAQGFGFVMEGLPRTPFVPTAPYVPQQFWIDVPLSDVNNVHYVAGAVIEDYTSPGPNPDTLCNLLGEQRLDDICRTCVGLRIFVAVHSGDWCLKQMNTDMVREICTNPTAVGTDTDLGYEASVGTYEDQPYTSLWRPGPVYNKDGDVVAETFLLNYVVAPQEPPAEVQLRVGVSAQPGDPNSPVDYCGIVWFQRSTQQLKCITDKTGAQHRADNTQPYQRLDWAFWHTDHYVYFEFRIDGTGADARFSGIAGDISLKGVKNA